MFQVFSGCFSLIGFGALTLNTPWHLSCVYFSGMYQQSPINVDFEACVEMKFGWFLQAVLSDYCGLMQFRDVSKRSIEKFEAAHWGS